MPSQYPLPRDIVADLQSALWEYNVIRHRPAAAYYHRTLWRLRARALSISSEL